MTRHVNGAGDDGLRHLNPITARLLMMFGPANANGGDNPLSGTPYDPILREHSDADRRHERWARQDRRHRARVSKRLSRQHPAVAPSDVSTPDDV
jgi:hypothetical protein